MYFTAKQRELFEDLRILWKITPRVPLTEIISNLTNNVPTSDNDLHDLIIQKMNSFEGLKFVPRGIGTNWIKCFVCGSIRDGFTDYETKAVVKPSWLEEDGIRYAGGFYSCQADQSFVCKDHEEALKIEEIFKSLNLAVYVDYRELQPNYVQIKLGACEKHHANLSLLQKLVEDNNNLVNKEIIINSVDGN